MRSATETPPYLARKFLWALQRNTPLVGPKICSVCSGWFTRKSLSLSGVCTFCRLERWDGTPLARVGKIDHWKGAVCTACVETDSYRPTEKCHFHTQSWFKQAMDTCPLLGAALCGVLFVWAMRALVMVLR